MLRNFYCEFIVLF